MTSVAVLVPVLRRPHRVAPLVESLTGSIAAEVAAGLSVELQFVCSPADKAQIAAVHAAGLEPLIVGWQPGHGDYARKINHAAEQTDARWLFMGADDLLFHPGWLTAALHEHLATGALVVGTNDLGNATVIRGDHATHLLVNRDYLCCAVRDRPGHLVSEAYDHQCVDVELVETAKADGVWAFAAGSVVEHLHPFWHKAPRDATYRKALRASRADRALLMQRRALWRQVAA